MVLGLTGGSGTGKSTASKYFESKGFNVADKRENGGALWVEGDEKTLSPYLEEIKSKFGVTGSFAVGRALKGKLGWWTKSEK